MSSKQDERESTRPIFVPMEQVVSARHGDDTVLLNAETGRYYTLNQTGSMIWEWLCEGVSRDIISERLHTMFDVPIATAQIDVSELIDQCLAASIVRVT